MPRQLHKPFFEGKSQSPPKNRAYCHSHILKKQPVCQWVEISFFSGNLPNEGCDGEIGHGTSLQDITYLFINKKSKPLKRNYILTTTKLVFLCRVLFHWRGCTCLLIGRDQRKVVLPHIFWNVGVD